MENKLYAVGLAVVVTAAFFIFGNANASAHTIPGHWNSGYEAQREQEWRDYQDRRQKWYDRRNFQQRQRAPLDVSVPPPPYGVDN